LRVQVTKLEVAAAAAAAKEKDRHADDVVVAERVATLQVGGGL
jgi:hypothetical protein